MTRSQFLRTSLFVLAAALGAAAYAMPAPHSATLGVPAPAAKPQQCEPDKAARTETGAETPRVAADDGGSVRRCSWVCFPGTPCEYRCRTLYW